MRICLISMEYPPDSPGGIGTYASNASTNLTRAGHEVHVITNGESNSLEQEDGVWVHRLPLHTKEYRAIPPLKLAGEELPEHEPQGQDYWAHSCHHQAALRIADYVRELHRNHRFHVVEAPDCQAEAFYIVRRRLEGATEEYPPVSIVAHAGLRILYSYSQETMQLAWLPHRHRLRSEEYTLQHADSVQVPSRTISDTFTRQGVLLPELQATVPYFFDAAPPPYEIPPEIAELKQFLLLVGRVEPRKGHDVALAAFAQLAPKHPDLTLVIVGAGENWAEDYSCEQLLEDLIPEPLRHQVMRCQKVSRSQVFAIQQAATIAWQPSRWETYPNSVLEAMLAGTPCVVTDSGGQADMIEEGRSGAIIPGGDARALAKATDKLLNKPDLIRRFGEQAQQRVRHLTDANRVLTTKIDLFEQMVARERATETSTPTLLIIVDAYEIEDSQLASCIDSVAPLAEMSSARFVIGCDESNRAVHDAGFTHLSHLASPWQDLPEDAYVVLISACVRFDTEGLQRLTKLGCNAKGGAGAFGWVKPASGSCAYASDTELHELLLEGSPLPLAVVVEAGALRGCTGLPGLKGKHAILYSLTAIAVASHGPLFHGDSMIGSSPEDGPQFVTSYLQRLAFGSLELSGLGGKLPIRPAKVPVRDSPLLSFE